MTFNLIDRAIKVAAVGHDQMARTPKARFRRDGMTPFIVHPMRVLQAYQERPTRTFFGACVAVCHDLYEETTVTPECLIRELGRDVHLGVLALTSRSKQVGSTAPRAERKRMDHEYLSVQPGWIQDLKLLDRRDNLRDGPFDPEFARLYSSETLHLLDALGNASQELLDEVRELAIKLAREAG